MLSVLHAVISVINAVLRLVAVTMVAGGAVLASLLVGASIAAVVLGLSSIGAFSFTRRKRNK